MNKHQAIYATHPNIVTINDETAFDKDGNVVSYDETLVQNYIASNLYKEQRAAAYPSIADQLDLIYHEGIDAWKAVINNVKEEFPKP